MEAVAVGRPSLTSRVVRLGSHWLGRARRAVGPAPSQTVPKGLPPFLEKKHYHQIVGAAYYTCRDSPCDFTTFTA